MATSTNGVLSPSHSDSLAQSAKRKREDTIDTHLNGSTESISTPAGKGSQASVQDLIDVLKMLVLNFDDLAFFAHEVPLLHCHFFTRTTANLYSLVMTPRPLS